jgi:hypothetical protein
MCQAARIGEVPKCVTCYALCPDVGGVGDVGPTGRRGLVTMRGGRRRAMSGNAARLVYLFIITSAQLRSQCDVWLALKASLQTV